MTGSGDVSTLEQYRRFGFLLALPGVLVLGSFSQAVAQKIYWSDLINEKIQRANLDGSEIEDVVATGERPCFLALDLAAEKIYWSACIIVQGTELQEIRRANLDGTDTEDLITEDVFFIGGIALDLAARKLYWTQLVPGSGDRLRRANLEIPPGETPENRSDIEDLVIGFPDSSNPLGIALDVAGGRMYWVDTNGPLEHFSGIIRRANLNGSDVEELVTEAGNLRDIALHVLADRMYWTDVFGSVLRANMDGTNIEELVTTGQDGPRGIALDLAAAKMYWADSSSGVGDHGSIKRADLDGSNVETIVPTGIAVPTDIALDLRILPCGDSIIDPGEECDDGGQSAACDSDCTTAVCGDSTLNVTAGEECDGGLGCTDCLCDSDLEPSIPPSLDCRAICGNGGIDPDEECDGGHGCTDCDCDAGFKPTDPLSLDCRPRCGNGSIDPGEECDAGLGCTGCLCDVDFEPTDPLSLDCRPKCGNGSIDTGEECDGMDDAACPQACLSDCTCGPFCGNGACDPDEDPCSCRKDCGTPRPIEVPDETCTDGIDNDCDGLTDSADPDCSVIPTVSAWGLFAFALLLLAEAKVYFNRRRTAQT